MRLPHFRMIALRQSRRALVGWSTSPREWPLAAFAPAASGVVFLGDRRVVRRYRIRTAFLRLLNWSTAVLVGFALVMRPLVKGDWRRNRRRVPRARNGSDTVLHLQGTMRNVPHSSSTCICENFQPCQKHRTRLEFPSTYIGYSLSRHT
jgi:hypothetical protein